jgi:hypothetical protein
VQIQVWLDEHLLEYDMYHSKAELLQLDFAHIPTQTYKAIEAAEYNNVKIVRLPIKYCVLNLIELACSPLKSYVRSSNTQFRLFAVRSLTQQLIVALHEKTLSSFYDHVQKVELAFRQVDTYVENVIEPEVIEYEQENPHENLVSVTDVDSNG